MEAEASSQLRSFKCPFHPNDVIQRVSLSPKEPFPLFCIECLLKPQIQSLQLSMTNLDSFLDEACQHYRKASETAKLLDSVFPSDLSSVLKVQKDSIAEFTQHIESQKAQVIESAAQTLEIIKNHIVQKRDELLQNLDLQLILLKTNLKYYENKINTFYGNQEAATSQDHLVQKINSFEGTEQFAAFLQQFKDDIQGNQNNERRSQINKKLKEMSDDISKQAGAFSRNSFLIKDQNEILNRVTAQILPVISDCFTQAKPPAKLLSYTDYQGLDLEELFDLLMTNQNDIKAIENIIKHTETPTQRTKLAAIFVEKPESIEKLSHIIYTFPPGSLRDKVFIIFFSIIQENARDILTEITYYETYVDGLSMALESQDERVLVAALMSIQTICGDHFQRELQDSLSNSTSLSRSLSIACSSQYPSVRALSKEIMDYLGFDRFEIERDEEYLHDCSHNYSKKPNFKDIFQNSQNHLISHPMLTQQGVTFPPSMLPLQGFQPVPSLSSMNAQQLHPSIPIAFMSMLNQQPGPQNFKQLDSPR